VVVELSLVALQLAELFRQVGLFLGELRLGLVEIPASRRELGGLGLQFPHPLFGHPQPLEPLQRRGNLLLAEAELPLGRVEFFLPAGQLGQPLPQLGPFDLQLARTVSQLLGLLVEVGDLRFEPGLPRGDLPFALLDRGHPVVEPALLR